MHRDQQVQLTLAVVLAVEVVKMLDQEILELVVMVAQEL
jgi:hypothetical protein